MRIYLLLVGALFGMGNLQAEVSFQVIVYDPEAKFVSLHSDVKEAVLAAGEQWAEVFDAPVPVTIEVRVHLGADVERAGGGSLATVYAGNDGQRDIWEQGAAAEIRMGIDPNPGEPDVEIVVSEHYLLNELWFNSDPGNEPAAVPTDRTDAVSVFLHELGHAFVFNGWIDWETGERPATYHSVFDALTTSERDNYRFLGPRTMHLYGGAVPLTSGNVYHLGNRVGEPGDDLIPDVMNGVVYYRGSRYELSGYALAVAEDANLPVALDWDRWSHLAFRQQAATSAFLKEGDGDGDGIPNLLEFLFGTDPLNPKSRATLAISRNRGLVSVEFPRIRSVRGYELQLQTTSRLDTDFSLRTSFRPGDSKSPFQQESFVFARASESGGFARIVASPIAIEPVSPSMRRKAILRTGPKPVLQDCSNCTFP